MSDDYYGQSAEARARRRRAIITTLLALLMIFFAAWYAMSYIRADDTRQGSSSTSSAPTCPAKAADVQVNVYNATDREGLATKVARDLRTRGFDVRTVANDPKKTEITGPGELRHGTNGTKGAELLSEHVGEFSIAKDERERTSVDVVLGPDYRTLADRYSLEDC